PNRTRLSMRFTSRRPSNGAAEPSPQLANTFSQTAVPAGAASQHRIGLERLAKFLSYYRPHLGPRFAHLGFAVLVAAATLALPLAANTLIKRLAVPGPQAMQEVWLIGALMLGLIAAQLLATFFVDYQGHVMGAKIENRLRRELFEHYQALSFDFY